MQVPHLFIWNYIILYYLICLEWRYLVLFKVIMWTVNLFQMLYCPPNITITTLWVDDGISECFLSTLSVTITGVFIILFGSIQLHMYHKYGTPVEIDFLPHSPLYYLQVFITFALCALVLLRFLLQIILLDPGVLYGYMVIISVILFELICNFSIYIYFFSELAFFVIFTHLIS